MNIPEEAIDAAAKALHDKDCGFNDWEYIHPGQWPYRDRALQALEAAAPYLMAEAWEQGWENARGNYCSLYTGRDIPEWVTLVNPYYTAVENDKIEARAKEQDDGSETVRPR